jgi:hypothetical protein
LRLALASLQPACLRSQLFHSCFHSSSRWVGSCGAGGIQGGLGFSAAIDQGSQPQLCRELSSQWAGVWTGDRYLAVGGGELRAPSVAGRRERARAGQDGRPATARRARSARDSGRRNPPRLHRGPNPAQLATRLAEGLEDLSVKRRASRPCLDLFHAASAGGELRSRRAERAGSSKLHHRRSSVQRAERAGLPSWIFQSSERRLRLGQGSGLSGIGVPLVPTRLL